MSADQLPLGDRPERVIGHTFGGVPITLADLADALSHIWSGDQTLEADALADVFEDRHWEIRGRRPRQALPPHRNARAV